MNNGRDCAHGNLARSCETCELEGEIRDLRLQLDSSRENASELESDRIAMRDKITELQADVEQLRDALRPVAAAFRAYPRYPQVSYWAYKRAAELVPEE